MASRRTLIVGGTFLFVALIIAAGGLLVVLVRREIVRKAAEMTAMNSILAEEMEKAAQVTPKYAFKVRLDGETTILAITVSNPSGYLIKNLELDGLTLGGREPKEKVNLPIRINELIPASSQEVILTYENLPWIGDDVAVERIDDGWAEKRIDWTEKWLVNRAPDAPPVRPDLNLKLNDFKGTSWNKGVRVVLDPDDARALKKRRDEGLKAKAKTSEGNAATKP